MSLGKRVRNLLRFGPNRRAVENVRKQYEHCIDSVTYSAPEPKLVLIGEYHFEVEHVEFADKLVSTMKPDCVLCESVPERMITSILESLKDKAREFHSDIVALLTEKTVIDHYNPQGKFVDLPDYRKHMMEKIIESIDFTHVEKITEVPLYRLSDEQIQLYQMAVEKLAIKKLSGLASILEEKKEEFDLEADDCIDFFKTLYLRSADTVISTMEKYHLELDKSSNRLLHFHEFLKNSFIDEPIISLRAHNGDSDFEMDVARVDLFFNTYQAGIDLRPFDSEKHKLAYFKLACLYNNSYSSKLRSRIKTKLDNLNVKREKKMVSQLDAVNDKNVVVYCGGHHLRDDSSVMEYVKSRNIPYSKIKLKEIGDSESIWFKSLLYEVKMTTRRKVEKS